MGKTCETLPRKFHIHVKQVMATYPRNNVIQNTGKDICQSVQGNRPETGHKSLGWRTIKHLLKAFANLSKNNAKNKEKKKRIGNGQTQKIQLNKNKIFKTIFERAQRKTPIFQINVWAVEALLIFLICNLAAKVLPFFPYLTSKTTKFLFFPTWKPFSSIILLLLR